MREDQDRNQGGRDNRLEENHRIGKKIAQTNGHQNWNEQYRSGRDYHNNQNPNNQGRQHYGADPNSSYRNSNINYGDGREHHDNNHRMGQNFEQNNQRSWPMDRGQNNYNHEERVRDNQFHQDNRSQHNFNQGNRNQNERYQANRYDQGQRYDVNRYTQSDNQFYEGEEPRMFDDRKQFEAEDYRYGSGNRHWPGHDKDDHNNNNRNNPRHHDDQRDNQGFFGRIVDQVREDWHTFTHPDDENSKRDQQQHRDFDRGYESGPRWADENDARNRNDDRRRNRDRNDNYNRY